MAKANDKQISGDHYKRFTHYEPWDVITAWELGYLDGTALKYIARWRHKNGIEDLKKAIHFLEKTIEVENERENSMDYGSDQHWRSVIAGLAALPGSPTTTYADLGFCEASELPGSVESFNVNAEGSPFWELHMKE